MAVYQRKSGVYYVQFYHNGKTFIKSTGCKNKAKAIQLEAKMRQDLFDAEVLGNPKEISLHEAAELYLEKCKKQSRYATMCSTYKWFQPYFNKKQLHDVTTAFVNNLINTKQREGVTDGTLKLYVQFINGVTKNGQNLGYRVTAYTNPKLKRVKNRLRYLTQDEETRLLNALDPNHEDCRSNHYQRKNTQHADKVQADYDLTILLLDTGARLNEIQKLEWKSVDLENRVIHLWRPKVENESVLHMTHRVFDVLSRRKQTATANYVFTDTKGGYRKSIQGLRKTMDKVGLQDITLHGLRHTCASKLVQNGLSIYEVKELLGHTDIQTTMKYAHLDTSKVMVKAKDILDLINLEPIGLGASVRESF